jgi:uncharacterized delta-60 repeat protein
LEDRTLLSAGDLDPTFGMGGTVFSDFQGPLDSKAQDAALQPDGKIVVVGGETNDFTAGFGVARFNPDGTLDTAFGSGGTVATSFPAASKTERATAVAIQVDGRIVVAGVDTNLELARYNLDGTLDASFAGSGMVTTLLAGTPRGIAIQPDQKIVVVATTGSFGGSFSLTRFNADGSLDSTFGTAGTVTSSLGSASGVVIELDGRIIVGAATSLNFQANNAFVVAAYNPNGSSVATFGNGGVVTTNFGMGNSDVAEAIVLQPDGKFVVAGATAGGQAYARYNEDGSLDATFGSGGKATVNGSGSDVTGLALQGDGKIVAAVTQTVPVSSTLSVFYSLTRLTPAGALDPTFGTKGQVNLPLTATTGLFVQNTGRIIVARTVGGSGMSRFGLDAFTGTGTPDTNFGANGEAIAAVTGTTDAVANAVLVQPDGKIIVASFTIVPDSSLLTRYNQNGTLDATFGNGGGVVTTGVYSRISALTLQPDGKILVTGSASPGVGPVGVALWRYNTDGSPDIGFGTEGRVIDQISGAFTAGGQMMALQPDGKIVVGFSDQPLGGGILTCGLLRFHADGSQDTGFLGNIPNLIPNPYIVSLHGLALQTDSKIVLSISSFGTDGTAKYALMRFNSVGSLDPIFGSGGLVAADFRGKVRVQIDGRIVMVGADTAPGSGNLVEMARFYPNGNRDAAFGTSGEAFANLGPNGMEPNDFVLQPDGKIVVAVRSTGGLFVLGRFDPNGRLDASFGAGGVASADLSPATMVTAEGLALQPGGRIIVAGDVRVAQVDQFAIARFLGDNPITDPNQRFVTHLYLDLLERSPDAGGLTTYVNALNQGIFTPLQLAQTFVGSPEYHTLEVQGLYGRLLGRPPDPAGLDHWVSFLNQGGTAQQLEAILIGSAEYFSRRGGGSALGFLQTLYSDVLQRPIDSGGAQSWGQALSRGASPTAVAAAILSSLEVDQIEVQNLYLLVLHRAADASGLATYTNALQRGMPNETLLAILVGSDEYFARV